MIKIDIFHHVVFESSALAEIKALLIPLSQKVSHMTVQTDALVAEVAQLTTVTGSVVAALNGIPQLVADAVAKALADNNVADAAAQVSVDKATADATVAVDQLKAAIPQSTPTPAPLA
jgi:hypothetical protein